MARTRYLFFLFSPFLAFALNYNVRFVGVEDKECLKALKERSDLVQLKNRPPASVNGLRYRVEADLPALQKVLQAFFYYDATLSYQIRSTTDPALVTIYVTSSGRFKLSSYKVFHGTCQTEADVEACCPFNPDQLNIKVGKPATSVDIVNAELQALTELSRCGYPLAVATKRRLEVDMAKKTVDAAVCVDEGPLSKFGPSIFFGLRDIHPRFIQRRITWKEGEIYDSDLIEESQRRLMRTDLFSSVYISHGENIDELGELPMQIRFTEAKHRQLSVGAYYATEDGPGVLFTWTHRNLRGMGEQLAIEGDFSKRYLAGKVSYKKLDFLQVPDQTYRAMAGLSRESIHPYLAFIYGLYNYIERRPGGKHTFSVGFEIEHFTISKSATNGTFALVGLPIFAKYDASNDVFDPTKGCTISYSGIPYQSVLHSGQHFYKQRLTTTFYIPMTPKNKMVLALRAQFGSIAGTKRKNVPLPKLFLGGSEDDLRGYRYLSVSPLNKKNQSLGGRAAIFASAELRFRFGRFGVVPFSDFGTVTNGEVPNILTKWFKSVGIGARYFAYFGPLRLDIGFPLDKRKNIDPNFRVYASVGQTF